MALGLTVWQDPHNAQSRFRRVRVRQEVLPLLEDVLDGGVKQALARTAAQVREDLDALDAIAALVVIRLILQFLVQAVGVILLRISRPEMPRPFRMWLYPLPALLASAGFLFILFNRVNWQKEVRYAALILLSGVVIYMVRAWKDSEWPFRTSKVQT